MSKIEKDKFSSNPGENETKSGHPNTASKNDRGSSETQATWNTIPSDCLSAGTNGGKQESEGQGGAAQW